jgi:predicted polyphosphate/ATP-dependent NAD kinase
MKRLGLIVNPLAGIGGTVALKGSDGAGTVTRAFELGAVPKAPQRVMEALRKLQSLKDDFEFMAYAGVMGADEAVECGFSPTLVGAIDGEQATTAADTKRAAQALLDVDVDLILFGGGDGTARDIYDVIGNQTLVLGIPCGVKIHSGVYAQNPGAAGNLAGLFLEGRVTRIAELEVMDIDEDAFREGEVKARLYGYMRVPDEPRFTQGAKGGGHNMSDDFYTRAIAERIVANMKPDKLYLIGSGTTTRPIMEKLGLANTLLGIDVVENGQLVAADCTERQLLGLIPDGQPAEIVLTPVGGQGYILGRGNQQLSPEVLRRVGPQNITIIATAAKINSLPNQQIRVDTGDVEVDALLRGPRRVVTNYSEVSIVEVV